MECHIGGLATVRLFIKMTNFLLKKFVIKKAKTAPNDKFGEKCYAKILTFQVYCLIMQPTEQHSSVSIVTDRKKERFKLNTK